VKQYLANQSSHTVNSMPAAISAIRANAVRCGARAGTQGNPIWEAFRYMDMDNSGDLHREELKDAFAALGVHITEAVLDQIMTQFDLDDNGRIQVGGWVGGRGSRGCHAMALGRGVGAHKVEMR
jgi:hypothetical protein